LRYAGIIIKFETITVGRISMEGFFCSLKIERTARTTCRTREKAKADVLDNFERLHNAKCRYSIIGYRREELRPVSTKPGAGQND
jgi:hypothetical protein